MGFCSKQQKNHHENSGAHALEINGFDGGIFRVSKKHCPGDVLPSILQDVPGQRFWPKGHRHSPSNQYAAKGPRFCPSNRRTRGTASHTSTQATRKATEVEET